MSTKVKIPKEATAYILFQRTEYLRFPKTKSYRALSKILPFSIYNRCVQKEARSSHERIMALYADDMQSEFDSIKSALPDAESLKILDIGCGIAGIDVLLGDHYRGRAVDFYLLDKSRVEEKVFYKFESTGAFYNSLEVASQTLALNGISEDRIHPVIANDQNEIRVEVEFDLVVSLISWGFHYPVEIYLERVHEVLKPGGHLIMDVRKKTDGMDRIKRRFAHVEVIVDSKKYERIKAVK